MKLGNALGGIALMAFPLLAKSSRGSSVYLRRSLEAETYDTRVSTIDRTYAQCIAGDNGATGTVAWTEINYYYVIHASAALDQEREDDLESMLYMLIQTAILWCTLPQAAAIDVGRGGRKFRQLLESKQFLEFQRAHRRLSVEDSRRMSIIAFNNNPEDETADSEFNLDDSPCQFSTYPVCTVMKGKMGITAHASDNLDLIIASILDAIQEVMILDLLLDPLCIEEPCVVKKIEYWGDNLDQVKSNVDLVLAGGPPEFVEPGDGDDESEGDGDNVIIVPDPDPGSGGTDGDNSGGNTDGSEGSDGDDTDGDNGVVVPPSGGDDDDDDDDDISDGSDGSGGDGDSGVVIPPGGDDDDDDDNSSSGGGSSGTDGEDGTSSPGGDSNGENGTSSPGGGSNGTDGEDGTSSPGDGSNGDSGVVVPPGGGDNGDDDDDNDDGNDDGSSSPGDGSNGSDGSGGENGGVVVPPNGDDDDDDDDNSGGDADNNGGPGSGQEPSDGSGGNDGTDGDNDVPGQGSGDDDDDDDNNDNAEGDDDSDMSEANEAPAEEEDDDSQLFLFAAVPLGILVIFMLLLARNRTNRHVMTPVELADLEDYILVGTGDPPRSFHEGMYHYTRAGARYLSTNCAECHETRKMSMMHSFADLPTINENHLYHGRVQSYSYEDGSVETTDGSEHDPSAHRKKYFVGASEDNLGKKSSTVDVHQCSSATCRICAYKPKDVVFLESTFPDDSTMNYLPSTYSEDNASTSSGRNFTLRGQQSI